MAVVSMISRVLHGRQAHFATVFKIEHFDSQIGYRFALLQIMTFTFFSNNSI